MHDELDLKALERSVWRSYHDDGVLDIFLGLLLLGLGVASWVSLLGLAEWVILVADVIWVVPAILVFWAGKKFVTIPRIGIVEFGPKRRARRITISLVLSASVLLGALVLVAVLRRPVWLGGVYPIPMLFAANALMVFGLGAYLLDLPRLAAYGLLFGIPVPASAILRQQLELRQAPAMLFAAAAAVILVVGTRLLLRFVRAYPLPNKVELRGNR